MALSRTTKSIKNVQIATIFYFLNLVLQFFSRKIFLEYLGSEVLGLNTTTQNLLGFLNIAELGIGTAVAYNLYKPLYQNDTKAINDIISIQGWLYNKIALIVLSGAAILMCFFPLIFQKAHIPLWYAYGSFSVLLIGALLSYFINYKQIILSADQKEYKITYCVQGVKIIKILLQIFAIRFSHNGFTYWLILEGAASIITAFVLDKEVRNEYPWLQTRKKDGKILKNYYPEIITKTKQVFFHKIGSFILSQTTPIVIYGFASLTLVAIYGNYMLIVSAVTSLMSALLNGIGAGVGNLVAEGQKEQIKRVFWELTSVRMWLALIFCFIFFTIGDDFITLWIGKDYLLPRLPQILILTIAFIQMTRTNDTFISAYGLYKDVWAPITEATINLGLSILLGSFWGLSGILSGVLISLILIICVWKPFFLFREGFMENFSKYIIPYGKLLIFICFAFITSYIIYKQYFSYNVISYWQLIMKGTIITLLITTISFTLLFALDRYFRSFTKRMLSIVINILK